LTVVRDDPLADGLAFVVVGGLNTDLIAAGVPRIVGPGELALGGTLHVRPGGKSRNVAQMLAAYVGAGRVAMIGRTSRDAFGLWQPPIEALDAAGVDTTCVHVIDAADAGVLPGVALIPVTADGRNQIYVVPGANAAFCPADVDRAVPLFARAAGQGGMLVLTLETPLRTALHAIRVARRQRLRVALDPGGLAPDVDYGALFAEGLDIVKPNAHEAAVLAGVDVHDAASAARAADVLRRKGAACVLITLGAAGAWCAPAQGAGAHLPVDGPAPAGGDETGCGDQAMAVLCAEVYRGRTFLEASRRAVRAGTLQFARTGVAPLSEADVLRAGPWPDVVGDDGVSDA